MTQTENVYLLRTMTLSVHVDFYRIDSENVFSDRRQAMVFAERLFEKTEPDHPMYRHELLTLPFGCSDGFYEKEIFGTSGKLLRREVFNENGCSEEMFSEFLSISVEPGALCLLAKNIETQHSSCTHERIGVVVKKEVIDGNSEYTIFYLNHEGFWGHFHTQYPCVKRVIQEPVDVLEKVVFLSALKMSSWQGGGSVEELMGKFLMGDIPWFRVPELIALGLKKEGVQYSVSADHSSVGWASFA